MSEIENGLRADVMRKRMEDKNTLKNKGSLYVGDKDEIKELIPQDNTILGIVNGTVDFYNIGLLPNINYRVNKSSEAIKLQSLNNSFKIVRFIRDSSVFPVVYFYSIFCLACDTIEIIVNTGEIKQFVVGIPNKEQLIGDNAITQIQVETLQIKVSYLNGQVTLRIENINPFLEFKYRILK